MGGAGPCSPPLDPPLLLDTPLLSSVVWNGCTRDPAECHGESPWTCDALGGLAAGYHGESSWLDRQLNSSGKELRRWGKLQLCVLAFINVV
jgi:hypothetical protein